MSPLTPDERAIFAENVRDAIRIVGDYHGDPEYKAFLGASLGVLADKLEAEPEPDCKTCGDRGWVVEGSLYDGSAEQLQCPDCEKYRTPEHIIRERDEARSELADVRTHLEDAHLAVEGVMGGSVPPDWSIADLAEDVARIAQREYHGRVEALEALRERNAEVQRLHALMDDQPARMALAGLIDALGEEDPDDDLIREAVDRGIAALVGDDVERTHTLVPNTALRGIENLLLGSVPEAGPTRKVTLRTYASMVAAAARAEHVDWPGVA